MNFLLPHGFKKIGAIIAPLGFLTWYCMQRGIFTRLFISVFGEGKFANNSPFHLANVIIAIISFFAFVAGIYFVTFSKEKVEDEMVLRTRVESFQFAAFIQIIFLLLGFLAMVLFKAPGKEGMLLFFVSAILLSWICFIGRFNYILHVLIKE